MRVEIKVPPAGESITSGVIAVWHKKNGDKVQPEEPLFDLETDKVTMPVVATSAGTLAISVQAGATVKIGDVVGAIDSAGAAPAAATAAAAEAPAKTAPVAAHDALSPAVRRLVDENNLDPAKIAASGRDGRLTKEDVLAHLEKQRGAGSSAPAPAAPVAPRQQVAPAPAASAPAPLAPPPSQQQARAGGARQTRKPMTPLRQRIAQRLVEAQHTAAAVTTFNEIDMTAVMELRAKYAESYQKRYGMKLGFMSFFVKAAVEALRTVPAVNAQIDGTDILSNNFYDIGVAVSTEKGLVVPVLRNADQLSFSQIEAAIADFATRARENKLRLDEMQGGSFTITNGGVFGSLLSTPILNPPQSAILGMHAIKKRPAVVGDEILARPMMYVALTYDHRLVDGKEGVTFLKRIAECIENPERLLLEI